VTPPRSDRERSADATHARGAQPLSDETRARIIALAQQELPVRAIAAEVGCSTGSVSNVCRLAGIPLDRGHTRAATEARQADIAAARTELAAELVALARDELARLRRPHTEYWGIGGSEPVVLSQLMPEPPPRARRDLITGAMALVDRHVKLTAVDAGNSDNLSAVDAWLAGMIGGPE
jgi:transposase-like protein